MANVSAWAQRHLSRVESDFKEADKDKSGALDFQEVYNVLLKSGFKGSQDEAKEIFKEVDTDKNKKISRNEFTKAMSNVPPIDFKEIVLRRAFKKLDTDGSGYLTMNEIMDATKSDAGIDVAAEKIAELEIYLIKDADKKISYEEFLSVYVKKKNVSAMETLFDKLDTDKSGKLSRQEILDGLKRDQELQLQAKKISGILINWCKGTDHELDYREFIKAYEDHRH
ncbi:hypothetical protein FSP39_000580 [Pinctada imbricata]|uniref:EF-hand domain-containing protein n=1 Tax=Pinctada imbricata TaxID=66713 RepID=A0AA88XCV0_PINIB|nr:hypothetical protein FSP39_000580 [Pinctada imbricata]